MITATAATPKLPESDKACWPSQFLALSALPETPPYTLAETLEFDFWVDSPNILN